MSRTVGLVPEVHEILDKLFNENRSTLQSLRFYELFCISSLSCMTENLNLLEELHWRNPNSTVKNDLILQNLLCLPKLKVLTCYYKDPLKPITKQEKEGLKKQVPRLKNIEYIEHIMPNQTYGYLRFEF